MTTSRLLARNTLINLVGQVVPVPAAVVSIPILLRHLGDARFGVLSLAWAAIGYFSLFDLGLGRALTQAVAVHVAQPHAEVEGELAAVSGTALSLMLALGVVGGLLLMALTPLIVDRALNTPPGLLIETRHSFYLLALSLPFVVTTAGLRGILEAHQEFGIATALRMPLAIFTFLGPLAVLPFSSRLEPVVGVLVCVRGVTWIAHLVVCRRRYAFLRQGLLMRWRTVGPLLSTGGWMTVSNVVSPLMASMDRFFIGAILPFAAVAQYVTPFELITKLLVLPAAMVGVLFPAFASTYASDRVRTSTLFARGLKALLLLLFPLLLVAVLFAREGLTLWVGPRLAAASTPVLQWLAAGILVNGLAQAPFAVLQGTGRSSVTARLHLVELPLYGGMIWWLAHRYGIAGVAMAWTFRVVIDTTALLVCSLQVVPAARSSVVRIAGGALLMLLVLALATTPDGLAVKAAYLLLGLTGYAVYGWTRVVDASEQATLRRWAHRAAWPRARPQ